MSCPLFIPSAPLGELVSIAPPLGDLYGGRCSADPEFGIGEDTLRRFCNFGYARGQCERASRAEADAVRLMVRGDNGREVEIAWATERNHHPVAAGVLAVDPESCPSGTSLGAQAHACASAYARRHAARPCFVGQTATAAHH